MKFQNGKLVQTSRRVLTSSLNALHGLGARKGRQKVGSILKRRGPSRLRTVMGSSRGRLYPTVDGGKNFIRIDESYSRDEHFMLTDRPQEEVFGFGPIKFFLEGEIDFTEGSLKDFKEGKRVKFNLVEKGAADFSRYIQLGLLQNSNPLNNILPSGFRPWSLSPTGDSPMELIEDMQSERNFLTSIANDLHEEVFGDRAELLGKVDDIINVGQDIAEVMQRHTFNFIMSAPQRMAVRFEGDKYNLTADFGLSPIKFKLRQARFVSESQDSAFDRLFEILNR